MGALTGDRAWFDDAVKQVLQFHGHLWDPQAGLYAHGKHMNQPLNPEFYWARANAWAMLASVELLDVLPEDHPGRERVLEALRAHVRSIAKLQSGTSGLWHQMLDKTGLVPRDLGLGDLRVLPRPRDQPRAGSRRSATAPWPRPAGSGLTTRVNAKGQVEGTCVGTTLASDHVYYYNRPQSVYATHGYGPVLLAGAEMIRLLQNPAHRRPVQAADLPLRPEEAVRPAFQRGRGLGLRGALARLALRPAPSARARGARSSRAGPAPGCGRGWPRRSGGGSPRTRGG